MAANQDSFESACDRVLAATENVNDQDIFDVLIAVATYRMARIPPDRHKAIARYIEECIPDMLVDARDAAAAHAARHFITHH